MQSTPNFKRTVNFPIFTIALLLRGDDGFVASVAIKRGPKRLGIFIHDTLGNQILFHIVQFFITFVDGHFTHVADLFDIRFTNGQIGDLCNEINHTRGNGMGRIVVDEIRIFHLFRNEFRKHGELVVHIQSTAIPVNERTRRCITKHDMRFIRAALDII